MPISLIIPPKFQSSRDGFWRYIFCHCAAWRTQFSQAYRYSRITAALFHYLRTVHEIPSKTYLEEEELVLFWKITICIPAIHPKLRFAWDNPTTYISAIPKSRGKSEVDLVLAVSPSASSCRFTRLMNWLLLVTYARKREWEVRARYRNQSI